MDWLADQKILLWNQFTSMSEYRITVISIAFDWQRAEAEEHRGKLCSHQNIPPCRSAHNLWWNPPPHMSSQAGLWSSYTPTHAFTGTRWKHWWPQHIGCYVRWLTSSGWPVVCTCSCLHALCCTKRHKVFMSGAHNIQGWNKLLISQFII